MIPHQINWFEIPATDIGRACRFYSQLLGTELEVQDMGGVKMCFFPSDENSVSGGLVQHEEYEPSSKAGVLIYLNGGENLDHMLARVEPAGGKVIRPKSMITPEYGYMAIFMDSEGNRLAMHSMG